MRARREGIVGKRGKKSQPKYRDYDKTKAEIYVPLTMALTAAEMAAAFEAAVEVSGLRPDLAWCLDEPSSLPCEWFRRMRAWV